MFSTPFQQYNLHKQMHEIAFYKGSILVHMVFQHCCLSVPVVLSIFLVNFYGCYIIIDLKTFKNSKGVLQGICSKLDGALLLSIADNFMWQVIHQLRGIKHHL